MLEKKYIKSRDILKVAFFVPIEQLPHDVDIDSIAVVGSFNDWDSTANPMSLKKDGKAYSTKIELQPAEMHQFRYVINGQQYFNDWTADDYVPNEFGSDNCIINTNSISA